MRLLKSNYHQQCTIWAGFLYKKTCFWGQPSGLSRNCLWPTLAGRWTVKRKKGNGKSDRAWSLQRFVHPDALPALELLVQNHRAATEQHQGHKTWSICHLLWRGHGSVPLSWPMSLHYSKPLTLFPTKIHRLAQTGMRGAATQSNN